MDISNDSNRQGPAPPSRRGFLGTAALAATAVVPAIGMLSGKAKAATGSKFDANAMQAFKDIQSHENAHVAFLVNALGSSARPKPTFKGLHPTSFGDFYYMARIFEITGVGAYLGALPSISNKTYLAAAGSIALVEGRHAGYLNVEGGHRITTQAADGSAPAFDQPLTQGQVVKAVSPFIASLNGGPAPSYKAGDDVSILNFALLLEYLEAEFYNINVPKYV